MAALPICTITAQSASRIFPSENFNAESAEENAEAAALFFLCALRASALDSVLPRLSHLMILCSMIQRKLPIPTALPHLPSPPPAALIAPLP